MAFDQIFVVLDRGGDIPDAPKRGRGQIAISAVARLFLQQRVELFERLAILTKAVKRRRQIVPRRIKLGRQFQRAFQQHDRIAIPADPSGHLGQHADRGNIGGILLQVMFEGAFGKRDIVAAQRNRRRLQVRIGRLAAQLLRMGIIGTP